MKTNLRPVLLVAGMLESDMASSLLVAAIRARERTPIVMVVETQKEKDWQNLLNDYIIKEKNPSVLNKLVPRKRKW